MEAQVAQLSGEIGKFLLAMLTWAEVALPSFIGAPSYDSARRAKSR